MNDEPLWTQIDENTIHFILIYQYCHHTVKNKWEWDY
jgi:hypothetical protein